MEVRPAGEADAAAIAAIHNEGIADRIATFETGERTAGHVEEWVASGAPPCLVAVHDARVVGWAKVSRYSDRHFYRGVGEASVYVAREARGAGLGRVLTRAIAQAAGEADYYKLVALVFPQNEVSLALFGSEGYREVGTYRRHGRLDGDWRDVVLLERLLAEAASP